MKLLFIALITLFVLTLTISSAEAQSDERVRVTIEKLSNGSIQLNWIDVGSNNQVYAIYLNDRDTILHTVSLDDDRFIIFTPGDRFYDAVINADRIGIGGFSREGVPVNSYFVDVPRPTVTAERLDDNSIKLTWENIHTGLSFGFARTYQVWLLEANGAEHRTNILTRGLDDNTLTIHPDNDIFDRINRAQQIGIAGALPTRSDLAFTPVPPIPSVTAERLDDNRLKISWSNIKTDSTYTIAIRTDSIVEFITFGLSSSPFIFDTDNQFFDQVNNADRIGVQGFVDGGFTSIRYAPTLPPLHQIVAAERLPDNSIKLSWEHIPTNGGYSVVVTTGSGPTVTVKNAGSSPTTIRSGDLNFDLVNAADRIGILASFGGEITTTLVPVPPPYRTLTTERLSDNSVELTWEHVVTSGSYPILLVEGSNTSKIADAPSSPYTISPTDSLFARVYAAERAGNDIGVAGTDSSGNRINEIFASIPSLTPGIPILSASDITFTSAKISWTAALGAVSYELFRDDIAVNAFSGLTHTDTSLASDETYLYTIRSYDSDGQTSLLSDTLSVTTPDSTPPLVTAVREDNDSLTVSWVNVDTDNGHSILVRSAGSDPVTLQVATSPSNFPSTHTHFDTINGAEEIGVEGYIGSVSSTTYAKIPPQNPSVTAERLDNNSVLLTWERVDSPSVDDYILLLVEGGRTNSVQSVFGSPFLITSDYPFFPRLYTADKIGIAGVDLLDKPINGIFTDIPNLTPEIPILDAEATATTVELSWTKTRGGDSYELFRDNTSIGTTTALTFTDTDVTTGTLYTYHVVAFNADLRGGASDAVIAIPLGPPSVTAVREDNNFLTVSWDNIYTDDDYNILVARDGFEPEVIHTTPSSPYTFSGTHDNFGKITNADRIGVHGSISGVPGTITYAPTLPPLGLSLIIDHNEHDNIIELTWEHVDSPGGFYHILLVEDGNTSTIITREITENPFVLIGPSHPLFPRIYNADEIGVAGTDSGGNTIDAVFRDVPNLTPGIPILGSEAITDTSAVISWTAALGAVSYELFRDGTSIENTTGLIFTDTGLTPEETYLYTITSYDKNSLASLPSSTLRVDTLSELEPSVTAVRQTDNSILVTWDGLPTATRYIISAFTEGVTTIDVGVATDSGPYTITKLHHVFDDINNAERIGVVASDLSLNHIGDYAYALVPAQIAPPSVGGLSYTPNESGSIEVSFIPLKVGEYTISYDIATGETAVDPATVDVIDGQVGDAVTTTLETSFGYVGEIIVSFGGTESSRLTIAVPPAPPTLAVGAITDTSIQLSWDAPRSATEYTIFLNGVFLATVTNPTYTHIGLTPDTSYTYTATSTYDSSTSALSDALPVSTTAGAVTPVTPTITDLSFEYAVDGRTNVSFTTSLAGTYRITYTLANDESFVPTKRVIVSAEQVGSPVTASILTSNGYVGTVGITFNDITYASSTIATRPAPPTLVAGDITDTSITLSWTAQRSATEYLIYRGTTLLTTTSDLSYIHTGLTPDTEYSYSAESRYGTTTSALSVPPLTVSTTAATTEPTVTVERQSDNSLLVSWENIPTTHSYGITYFDGSGRGVISTDATSPYTIPISFLLFDRINNADRIGVRAVDSSLIDTGDFVYAPVPAQITPTVTLLPFTYNDDGNTLVSFTSSLAGEYTISYAIAASNDESAVTPVTVTAQANIQVTAPPLLTLPGYAGTVTASFADTVYATGIIKVPPAAPTLSTGVITPTSIQLTWEESRSATEYLIYENDHLLDTIHDRTFTHTGLDPNTQYTYTIQSRYGSNTSTLSAPLPVTTASLSVTALSFDYNANGNTLVSFIPSEIGDYIISYATATGETDVASKTVTVSTPQLDKVATTTLLTSPGYVGDVIASFGGIEHARRTIETPPAPPTLTVGAITDTSIQLSWDAQNSATHYQIFENLLFLTVVTDLTYTHTGLDPDTEYTYTVTSTYGSSVSASSNVLTVSTTAGTVTPVTPTVTALSFKYNDSGNTIVSFTPSVVGVHTISYDIAADNTESFVPSTTVNVSVIDEPATTTLSTSYGYVGTVGVSFDGTEYASGTISVPPDSPTLSLGTVTATSIEITWEAPRSATEYVIYYGADLLERTNDLSYTHTGLIPGTEHTYTVAATYDIRTSALSTSLTATTSSLPAGTLSFSYNDDGNTLVSLTPTVAGDYTISYAIAASNDETSVDSVTVTALANTLATAPPLLTSHGYAGVVTASLGSAEYATGTVAVPPAPPTLAVGTITDTSIQFSWDAPRSATEYLIYEDGNLLDTISTTTFTHSSLTPDTEYSYTVQSRYGTSTSALSAPLPVSTTPASVSTPPSVTVQRLDDNSLTVSWENIRNPEDAYLLYVTENGVDKSTGFSLSDDSVTFDSTHRLFDRINNAQRVGVAGLDGVLSLDLTFKAVPPLNPTAGIPTLSEETITDTTVIISWVAIADAVSYELFRDGDSLGTTAELTFTDTGLTAGTDYVYTIRSIDDSSRTSESSVELQVTTLVDTPPGAPTLSEGVITDTTITLSWIAIPNAVNYELFRDGDSLGTTRALTFTDENLTAETDYSYTIRSIDDSSRISELSAELAVTTLVDPTPPSVTAVRTADNSILLTWENIDANFNRYSIALVEGGDTNTLLNSVSSPHTISPTDPLFPRIYNADKIGIGGFVTLNTPLINTIFRDIPPLTPGIPTLSKGDITDTTVTLSWTATLGAVSYELFRDGDSVETTTKLTFTDENLTAGTAYSYTIESIDDASLHSITSAPLSVTTTFESVTPVISPVTALSFDYNTSGNTLVSFIPSAAGSYTISYTIADSNDETDVASVTVNALLANSIVAVTLLTSHGYAGTVAVSFDSTEHERETIAVPPAPPTLSLGAITPTTIQFSWNAPRSATEYVIYENGIFFDRVFSTTTYINTGLTPDTPYTYTIESRYGTNTSTLSAPLTASTAASPVTALSFDYNGVGNTLVSFTSSLAGDYTISYTTATGETAVPSVPATVSDDQVNKPVTATILTSPGYSGTVAVLFGDEKYARETIAVPPAPPTLRAETITPTSIVLSWDASHGATEYLIYQGTTLVATIPDTTYAHSPLTPQTDYSYTIQSRYDGITSIRSDALPVTTASLSVTALSFEYNEAGNTEVTFTPLVSGEYTISYETAVGETAVTLVTVNISNEEINDSTTDILETSFGYVGEVVVSFGGIENVRDTIAVPPAPPTLVIGAVTHTSIQFSWDESYGATEYLIYENNILVDTVSTTTFTHSSLNPLADYIYTIQSRYGTSTSALSAPLPVTTLAQPSVTAERLDDDSLKVSWENIPTDSNYAIVILDDTNTPVRVHSTAFNTFIFDDEHAEFNQINDAERIGVHGSIGGVVGTPEYTPVPALNPSVTALSFDYNDNGNTLVSFTSTIAGDYTISYDIAVGNDEIDVPSVTATVSSSQINKSVTATLLTLPGYVGTVGVSFDDREYETGSVQVPPAPPTLGTGTITATSIQLSWEESRSATEYLIYEDGILVGTVSTTTFTHTGLTLDTEYTYTAESRYNGIKSTLSAALPVTTAQVSVTSLSFEYNDNGNTIVSFTPSVVGVHTISYDIAADNDEIAVTSTTVDVSSSQINNPVTTTLLTSHGYTGTVTVSFDGTEHASDTIDVPPAPPTLSLVDTTATSVELSWIGQRGTTLYELFRDGNPIKATTKLTFTDINLIPDREYTYTITSTDGTTTSALSAPLPVTTASLTVDPLTFTYNNDGSTEVSFTPSAAGEYTINYAIATDETDVTPVPVTVSTPEINSPVIATLETSFGYAGTVGVSFGDREYASDTIAVPPAPPTLVIGTITDTSIQLTWDAPRSATEYLIYDDGNLVGTVSTTTFTHTSLAPNTQYTYTAESTYGSSTSVRSDVLRVSTISTPVEPSVTAVRQADNSILVSWENIPTTNQYIISSFTGDNESPIGVTSTSPATILPSFTSVGGNNFDLVNSADRIGVASIDSTSATGDFVYAPVPAQITPTVTLLPFTYNDDGNTLVSFTTSLAGEYIISYTIAASNDESAVTQVTVTAQANTQVTAPPLLTLPGYAGEVAASFADTVYATGTIKVPPAAPTLREGTVTATSIQLVWDAPRGAIGYEIFEDGSSLDTVTNPTYTHTGLTPNEEYTYTVTSTDGTTTSAASNVVSATTAQLTVEPLTFTYNANGHTIVSFTPSEAGSYTINYNPAAGESNVPSPSTVISADHVDGAATVTLLTSPGYVGEVAVLFGGIEYANKSIAVPPAPPTLVAGAITDTSIQLSWNEPRSATQYTIFLNGVFLATVTDPTYTHTGLAPNTEHTYTATSTYDSSTSALSAPLPVSTTAGTVTPVTPTVTALSFKYNDSGNTIVSFTPSVVGVHTISYDIAADNTESFVPSTTVNVSVIDEPATTTLSTSYGYVGTVGVSFDGTEYASGTISVPPDSPTLSLGTVTATSIEITWEAPRSATEYVIYEDGNLLDTISTTTFTHSSLTPDTEYSYTVQSRYGTSTSALSAPLPVSTTSASVTTPPSVTVQRLDDNSLLVSWENIRNPEDAYLLYVTENGVDKSTGFSLSDDSVTFDSTHRLFDRINNAQRVGVAGLDGVLSLDLTFKAVPPLNPTAGIPTLSEETITDTTVIISWVAIADAVSYELFRDGDSLGTTAELTFTDTGLTAGTDYVYTIRSIDDSSRTSESSVELQVTTLVDTPPGIPTLSEGVITDTTVTLSWVAIADAVSYELFRDGTSLGTTRALTFTDENLTAETDYSYTIRSIDDSSRISELSAELAVTTIADPTPPSVTAVRTADNSILLTWENIDANFNRYSIALVEGGDTNTLLNSVSSPHTISPTDPLFPRIYNADKIGIGGFVTLNTPLINTIFRDIPPLTPGIPTLSKGDITDTTVTLSWTATLGAVSYELFRDGDSVETTTKLTFTDENLTAGTAYSYTIESIDDASLHSITSAPLSVTTTFESVTPTSSLSFTYNESGNTIVSLTPSETGEYTISYDTATDETAVDSVTVTASQINNPVTATLETSFGYVGDVIASFGGTESTRGTIAVPPAPPTLVAGAITKTSIEITWDAPRSATEYVIYENGVFFDRVSSTTYIHTDISPQTDHTYTVESYYNGIKSTLSAPLTLTTATSPVTALSFDYNDDGNTLVSFTSSLAADYTISYDPATGETAVASVSATVSDDQVNKPVTATLLTSHGYSGTVAVLFDDEKYAISTIAVPPAPPTLRAETITPTSIVLSWDASHGATEYLIYEDDILLDTVYTTTTFTHSSLTPNTQYTYTAESRYDGIKSVISTELVATTLAEPSVTAERQADNSLIVSWENIPTESAYAIVITNDINEAVRVHFTAFSPYTILTTHPQFTQINNAERIGVHGSVGGENGTPVYTLVPPLNPSVTALSFDYNGVGNTLVSFTSSLAGDYTISYTTATDETDVDSVTATVSDDQVNKPVTATLLTGPGYSGTVAVSLGDIEYESDTIAVPPAPPTLSLEDTTATTVELEWTAPRGANSYELFRNDISIAKPILPTFIDTGLTTGVTYTYHVISVDNIDQKSDASNVLTVTPVAKPSVTAVRQVDNSILVSWENIPTSNLYSISSFVGDVGTSIGIDSASPFTIPTFFTASSGNNFDLVNSADRIGVTATDSAFNPVGSYEYATVPAQVTPPVTSISFDYNGVGNTLVSFTSSLAGDYTISYDIAVGNDEIDVPSVTATVSASQINSPVTTTLLTSPGYVGEVVALLGDVEIVRGNIAVPPAPPTLVAGDITDTSITLSWTAQRSATEYLIYRGTTLLTTTSDLSYIHTGLTPDTEYSYSAESRYGTTTSALSTPPLTVSTTAGAVTPVTPTVTLLPFTYNDDGNTLVSFTPSLAGEYTISYTIAASNDETDVGSVPVTVSAIQANKPVTDTLLTSHGYAGVVAILFDGAEYNRGTIAVPPAPPVLSLVDTTATSVELSWTAQRGAAGYVITVNGTPLPTIADTSFIHSSLTPDTAFSYIVRSTYGSSTSAPSNTVSATTDSLPTGSLSFDYNDSGHTIVSFTPTVAGSHTISYTQATGESAVNSVPVPVSDGQVNTALTATLLTSPGYTGEAAASFADIEYATGTVAVPLAAPTLSLGAVTTTSIELSWTTPLGATGYVITVDGVAQPAVTSTTYDHSPLIPNTAHTYTVQSTFGTSTSAPSNEVSATTDSLSTGSLTFTYNDSGHTIVSFTPTVAGQHTISYVAASGESAVNSVPVPVSDGQVNTALTATLLTSPGYVGDVIASFGGIEHARRTIETPPAPPTLTVGAITDTSIQLSWDAQNSATHYQIFENLLFLTVVTDLTYTHTGLDPDTEYTYTVTSTYGSSVSASSNVLTVSTTAGTVTPVTPTVTALSFKYNDSGNTIVSFTPSVVGVHTISYDIAADNTESFVPSTTVNVSVIDEPATTTLSTSYGYVGTVGVSFDGTEYASGTISVPPDSPTLSLGTVTATSIEITWEAPRSATEYVIYYGADLLERTNDLSYTHTGLIPGTEHTYTVAATYDGRTSALSTSLTATTSSLPTGTLSFSYNDDGNTLVSLTPTAAGDYTLSYTITAGSDESAVDSVTVTALANTLATAPPLLTSHGYAGVVTASLGSAEYATGTIKVPSAVPTLSAGGPTATTIDLSWTESRGATSYVITANNVELAPVTGTTHTHSGLTPETEYTYTITSNDGTNTSAPSNEVSATTSSLTAGSLSFDYNDSGHTEVSFTPSVAGSHTISYTIATGESSVDSKTVTVSVSQVDTTLTTTLLTSPGYAGTVTASFGDSQYATGTIAVPPAPPTLSLGTVTATTVELSWTESFGATRYVITANGTPLPRVTGTSFSHSPLTPDTAYTYTITSTGATGTSAPSNEVSATTSSLPTGSLSFDYNDSGNTIVSFTPPVAGQHTISYVAASGESSVGSKTITVSVSQVDTTLTTTLQTLPGYAGTVTASFGSAQYATGTVAVPPAPPTLSLGAVTATTVELSWTEPFGAASYVITANSEQLPRVTGTTFSHSSLTPDTAYTYTITSTGATGTSIPSNEISTTTATLTVGSLTFTYNESGHTEVSFTPSEAGEYAISYDIASGESAVNSGIVPVPDSQINTVLTATLQTLPGYVGDAVVSFGGTEYARATVAVPPATPTLSIEEITVTTVELSWTEAAGATKYELFRGTTSLGTTAQLTLTDTGLTPDTPYTYHVVSIGALDQKSDASNILAVTTLAGPVVTVERESDDSLTVSWKNIRTNPIIKIFNFFVINDDVETNINFIPPGVVSSFNFPTTHAKFNEINDADEVGVAGTIDGEFVDKTFADVPQPSISARIQSGDSTKITLDNILPGNYILHTKDTTHQSDPITVITGTKTYNLTFTSEGLAQLIDDRQICISNIDEDDDIIGDPVCGDLRKSGGSSNEWETKPTFGSSWDTQTQLVDAGFVFNGIPLTITDNWHTDFDLTSSIIGENNIVHIKGHASNDFKSVTLSLGIPEIGKKYDAESHIILNLNRNYTAPSDYQVTEIIHDQKEKLVNEDLTSASLSKVKCTPADETEQCIDFEISFTMMAPLTGEVLAISAMDTRYREAVTFINSGVEFVGESLLESQTHVLTQKYSNQHPAETIELTQLDRRYQMWEDQNGYLWTQNEYGSWLQITMPDIIQRDDPATSVMTRAHSNFANLVTQEQDRATLIFDSSAIQGIPDEPFTHDEPIRLEKLSDPEVLEILHMQALLAEELLCDCTLHED